MTRVKFIPPSHMDRNLKCKEDTWEMLGREAERRGLSRPKLARELLHFMLENREIMNELFANNRDESIAAE
jgi:hypothetical protein